MSCYRTHGGEWLEPLESDCEVCVLELSEAAGVLWRISSMQSQIIGLQKMGLLALLQPPSCGAASFVSICT